MRKSKDPFLSELQDQILEKYGFYFEIFPSLSPQRLFMYHKGRICASIDILKSMFIIGFHINYAGFISDTINIDLYDNKILEKIWDFLDKQSAGVK